MKNIKPYENYKSSSIDWLGDIPEHWETRKIKSLFNNPDSLFIDGDWIESKHISGNDVKYITTGNIGNGKYKEQGSGFITFETFKELNCTEVFENDILISRLNLPMGRCCLSPKFDTPLIVSVDVVICRPDKNYHRKYLTYLMNSRRYQENASLEARGATMKRVSRTILGNFYLTIPPISEQQTIAKFLDYKIGKIDRFIRKKKQLIKLLNEQKAAIINQAITKGINENVKMKPSGIDWLGEIPEHWEVWKMKRLISLITDFTANGSFADLAKNVIYRDVPDFARLVRLTDLRVNFDNSGVYIDEHSYNYLAKSSLFGGEILMANVGAYSGHSFLVPEKLAFKASLAPNMFLLKFKQKKVTRDFIFYCLNSKYLLSQLLLKATTTAQPKLNKTNVKDNLVVLPPIDEQIRIVEFIQAETANINLTISTIEKEIALVQEYRTTLIAEAVTGKIDVRDYEIPTIEETEEIAEEFETDEVLEEIEVSEE